MKRLSVELTVIGNLLLDEVYGGPTPEQTAANLAPELEPGGAALFTCLAARAAGLKVGLHSVVGQDYPMHLFAGDDIKLSLHQLTGPGGRTVIRYSEEGRSLTHEGPGHLTMSPETHHPFDSSYVHIAPMPWERQLFHLQACEPGTAFLDPYPTLTSEQHEQLLPLADRFCYLVVSCEELDMDVSDIHPSIPLLIKQGAEGGYCRKTGTSWVPAKGNVIDLTGAGDSFVGGLAAGLAKGMNLQESLNLGAEMSALALSDIGARAFCS